MAQKRLNPLCTRLACLLLSLLLGLGLSAYAQEYEGKVVGISDGDTLVLLTPEKRQIKVRLAEIDAPEKSQAFGQRSRQSLADFAFGKQIKVKQQDRDRYGQVVGRVYVEGLDVNAEQIKRGMAWVYREYARDQTLFNLEQEARKAKRGLWSDPHAIPPWEYRHNGKRIAQHRLKKRPRQRNRRPQPGLAMAASAIVRRWRAARRLDLPHSVRVAAARWRWRRGAVRVLV